MIVPDTSSTPEMISISKDATGPKPLKLRQNVSWTLVGNIVYAACQWGMLVVMAKVGSPEMVGQFALALAVTAPIMMFASLRLQGVQATDAKRQYQFGDYLALRLATTTVALLAIGTIAFAGGYRWEMALVILAVGVAKAVETVSDVVYGFLRQHERMDRIACLKMIKGTLSLAAMGATLYFTRSVLWSVIALIGAWTLLLTVCDSPSVLWARGQDDEVVRPRWCIGTLVTLGWLVLPLGFASALISLNTNIPRYFIEDYLGERELGIFAAMAYFMVAGRMITDALGHSATPRFAQYYAAGKISAFSRLLVKLVGLTAMGGALGVLVVLLAGRWILTVIYTPEYAVNSDVFVYLAIASAIQFSSAFFIGALTAMRYFVAQLLATLASGVALTVLCILLVSRFGMIGAAWALLATALFNAAVHISLTVFLLRRPRESLAAEATMLQPQTTPIRTA